MQTTSASAPYTTTTAIPHLQNSYQLLSESEIYATKKQYLGLLPPPQVIDICLTFEAHAPIHVRSSVWPYDIRAAIAAIQAHKAQTPGPAPEPSTQPSAPPEVTPAAEKTFPPQPSTSQDSASSPSPAATPAPSATAGLPAPALPHIPSAPPVPHYPHQPYYHPSYPHAPYYAPPHTPYGYPHAYPPYPQPSPAPYRPNPPGPLFTNAPLTHPVHPAPEPYPPPPPLNPVDDLPSYEEMIVEALIDSGDPEGCAPKSLFSWMAMHYPLQTNFRPSASQALQKAYKRGRLEKGSNGKYRLNENWEGGNTSKRTTRRPQTLAQAQPPSNPSSPFTHSPLPPHGIAVGAQTRPPPPGQPPGYTGYHYGYPYQGISQPGATPPSTGASSQKQRDDTADNEVGEGSDAWEAAQNILKAINFGQLLQIASDGDISGVSGATPPSTSSAEQRPATTRDQPSSTASGSHIPTFGGIDPPVELNGEHRAALQAQLALLAAQLAELADVSEGERSHVSQGGDTATNAGVLENSGAAETSEDDDGDDMEMVEVPMASLAA
ncbi:hypothetical protein F5I97DRAFT_1363265 [Phlebopus sp. FC_14]|nr:hypothetical protein F5I97DRAFT_1363265 [Phlebopus sp. FC_14]